MPIVAPALLTRPELDPISYFYYAAFIDLSAARQAGMAGPQRLNLPDILAYCELFEIDERVPFFYNMRAMDDVYMNWVAKAK